MKRPNLKKKVSVLYSPGTNCEEETMAAFRLAGANATLLFLLDVISGRKKVTDCDIFCIPGGFSWGDYIKEGIITAAMIAESIQQLVEAEIPMLLICNGFQIGARAKIFGPDMTLTRNVSNLFCSRPVRHLVLPSNCVWTRGLAGDTLSFPSAHAGGLVVYTKQPNVVMTYASESPNGGPIAGVASKNGLIFGLMNHPEREYGNEDGQKIFRNGIAAA